MLLLRTNRSLRATPALLAGLLLAGTALVPAASASALPLYKNPHADRCPRVNDLMAG